MGFEPDLDYGQYALRFPESRLYAPRPRPVMLGFEGLNLFIFRGRELYERVFVKKKTRKLGSFQVLLYV